MKRNSTPDEIEQSIKKLNRRVADVEALDPDVTLFNDPGVRVVESKTRDTIRDVFGEESPEFKEHGHLRIWRGSTIMNEDSRRRQAKFAEGIPQTATILKGLISRLEEKREDMPLRSHAQTVRTSTSSQSNRVFVVHGRDGETLNEVARLLTSLDLEPIVLGERPNRGRTIIEKFEDESEDIAFAVVLLTPDDVGRLADEDDDQLRPRARQNVLFELGYTIGRLGRPRVCALYKGRVEMLSDFYGVAYVPMDDSGAWRTLLAKELKEAGLPVDLNKL